MERERERAWGNVAGPEHGRRTERRPPVAEAGRCSTRSICSQYPMKLTFKKYKIKQ